MLRWRLQDIPYHIIPYHTIPYNDIPEKLTDQCCIFPKLITDEDIISCVRLWIMRLKNNTFRNIIFWLWAIGIRNSLKEILVGNISNDETILMNECPRVGGGSVCLRWLYEAAWSLSIPKLVRWIVNTLENFFFIEHQTSLANKTGKWTHQGQYCKVGFHVVGHSKRHRYQTWYYLMLRRVCARGNWIPRIRTFKKRGILWCRRHGRVWYYRKIRSLCKSSQLDRATSWCGHLKV